MSSDGPARDLKSFEGGPAGNRLGESASRVCRDRINDARTARPVATAAVAAAAGPRHDAPPAARSRRRRFEIVGALDRHALEALFLDLRRLGDRMGFDITAFEVSGT